MISSKVICIAGKNSIAVEGLNYCLRNHSDKKILFLPHYLDDGIDNWQPSFKNFGLINNLEQVSLEDIYEIENLIFISLEFADLVNTNKFKSKELFNIHFSMLPKYKGMYTSAHPLLNGDNESGVTIHKIDEGIDTGEIIFQRKFSIDIEDTAESLYFKYLDNGIKLFIENADNLINKKYTSFKQNAYMSSYFSKNSIDYKNLKINFKKTAFEIHNQFRAFNFRNYQLPQFENWNIIKTKITNNKSIYKPGTIVIEDEQSFLIATVDYDIELKKDYYPLLWESARNNNLENLILALKNIEMVDLRNNQGWNALIIACYEGSHEIVVALIEAGANPSTTNYKGTSALMYAFDFYTRSSDLTIFKYLLNSGANKSSRDYKNKSLVDYLEERGYEELMCFLT